jgi:hypothetical protein
MPSLRELQTDFMDAVFTHGDHAVAGSICSDGLPVNECINIYRRNVSTNLRNALQAIYPVVFKLVGPGFFHHAAETYVRRHPSVSGDLNDYGGAFWRFLAAWPPAATLPYLPDTARLEWQVQQVFHAAEHAGLPGERLAGVAAERYGALHFHLHPAVRLFESAYPVHRIWQLNQDGYAGDHTVELSEGGVRLLIQRNAELIELQPLPAGAWVLLQSLATDRCLGEACDAAFRAEPAFDLAGVLQACIGNQVLVDASLD